MEEALGRGAARTDAVNIQRIVMRVVVFLLTMAFLFFLAYELGLRT